MYTEPNKTNGLAIAGFVVSLVSMVLCCCGLLGLVGLILSAVGLSQINKKGQKGKGLAIAGLVIGLIVVALWVGSLIINAINGVAVTEMYQTFFEGFESGYYSSY